jgi:hypothetical protein
MKETHKIDELFKKSLADYRSELPSDKVKKKIFGTLVYYQYLKWSLSILALVFISGSIWAIYNFLPVTSDSKMLSNSYPINKKMNTKTQFSIENKMVSKNEENKTIAKKEVDSKSVQKTNKKQQILLTSEEYAINEDVKLSDAKKSDIQISREETFVNTESLDSKQSEIIVKDIGNVVEKKAEIKKLADETTSVDGLIKKEYKKKLINRFELIVGGSFFYVDKKLSAKKEYDNLVKIRENGEVPISNFSPYFGIRYNFNNFFVQSGFQYQKYGEKMDIQTSEMKFNVVDNWFHRDSLYYVKDSINPPGAWHIDTIWYVTHDTTHYLQKYRFQKNNNYKYIEIPFLIGKKFDLNPFILEVSTGISVGLILKSDAEILANDTRSVIVLNNEKSAYFNQVMLNYLFRLSLRYHISQKWSVYISPDVKYNMGSIFKGSNYPVKQNYILYGIGSGLIYKL